MLVISRPLKKQDLKTSQAEEIMSFLRKCWILYEECFSFPVLWQKYLRKKKRVFSYLDKVQNLVFFNMILLGILYTVLLEKNNIWLNSTT